MSFKKIEWTDEVIEEFWRYWSERPEAYFAESFGDTIVRFSSQKRGSLGQVLDYGAGSGGLLAALSRAGIQSYGLDFGKDSTKRLARRFANDRNVKGIIDLDGLSQLGQSFDTAFLIETIEHMPDRHLQPAMQAIYSALKPGGWLVVSTPNAEDIQAAEVFCPVSKLVFHPMQHLRSWNRDCLSRHLSDCRFIDSLCLEIDLNALPYHSLSEWVKSLAKQAFLGSYKPPHLFAFAQKPSKGE